MDGDLKGIRDFMQNTGAYFDDKLGNEIQHLECISNIKIYPLQSLITTKIAKMQEEGIAYLLEVPNPVMESGMRTEDLLRCIGILIDNALEEAGEEGYYYSLKILDEVRHIPMNRILYFEAAGMNHQICLHMKDEIIGFYGSLQNLQEELGGRFWRCHRGCLVNIYRVSSIFQSMKPA